MEDLPDMTSVSNKTKYHHFRKQGREEENGKRGASKRCRPNMRQCHREQNSCGT